MSAKFIELQHFYPASVEEVWRVATDWECLERAVDGLVRYYGLPTVPMHANMHIETEFSLFGFMPKMPWTMQVMTYDPIKHIVQSHEFGGAVKSWDHWFEVVAVEGGAELRERITIDAGGQTWLYVIWGRFMYGRRHPARSLMLSSGV